jgi:lysozyme
MMPAGSPDAVHRGARVRTGRSAAGPVNTQYGPDLASYQHPNGQPVDWSAVAGSAQAFAIVKATEMTSGGLYVNPYLQQDLADAEANGIVAGSYAFARPEFAPGPQADAFAHAVGALPAGSLPPVLDLETTGGLSPTDLITWTHTFLDRLQADTGIVPMIYTGPNFWNSALAGTAAFNRYPLWEASYTGGPPPQTFGGWPTYTLWQFTDNATIPGISGGVDQSLLNGTRSALTSVAQPAIPPSLSAPASLSAGQSLRSPNGQYQAVQQSDGNLVVYGNGQGLWSTRTWGNDGAGLALQSDGNLVLYSAAGQPLWSTRTAGSGGQNTLVMQDDGNLVLYGPHGALWSSATPGTDALNAPGRLLAGQFLHSANGRFRLAQQGDGNLVLYGDGQPIWATGTDGNPGATLALQTDGNLVVYDINNQPIWSSRTAGTRANHLVVQDVGKLVLSAGRVAVWTMPKS